MGAGFYGIPLPVCAKVMIETIVNYLNEGSELSKIAIVALDSREYKPFKETFATFTEKEPVT
jgi:O-acetyl-ADP-ribose deacetylase (regulator of RNase III)